MTTLLSGLSLGAQTPCRRLGSRRVAPAPIRLSVAARRQEPARRQPTTWCAAVSPTAADKAEGKAGAVSKETEDEEAKKSAEYSKVMSARMGTTLHYKHELGMNYSRILPDLIVGSCPQTVEDAELLFKHENVRTIFCLQEDTDMEHFKLDINPIQERCTALGIEHVRFRIRDFDAFDLRRKLPKAVSRLARSHNPTTGTVYIHCTAGMGRAPAAALAYMFWLRGYELDAAWELLRGLRTCSPRLEAIRSATVDLLVGTEPVPVTLAVSRTGFSQPNDWLIAGMDVGWGIKQALPMEVEKGTGRMVLKRMLSPGKYAYKFAVRDDDKPWAADEDRNNIKFKWSYSADHPTLTDGSNTNNYLEVLGREIPEHLRVAQSRILATGGTLTEEERAELRHMLCPWASHSRVYGEAGSTDQPLADYDFSEKTP